MDLRISIITRLCALLLAGLPTFVGASELRIGVLAWFGDQTAATQWQTLGTALQAHLPHTTVLMSYHDMNGLERALAAGQLDFIITNPGHYVVLEARHRATRIATQRIEPGLDSEHVVGSAVIVPNERTDLQTLDDLRGKRIAATVPDGFSGWMTVWAELKRRDIDPEHQEVTPLFAGLPMSRVIESLDRGEADAGILRVCLLEHLVRQGHIPAGRYRVLSAQEPKAPCLRSTPAYPGWAFAATAQTPDALARAALVALLSLDGSDGVLRWGVPADYHPVHAMLRELQVAPYEFLREHSLKAHILQYWPIGAGLLALLLLGLLYTLRVDALVQRRTRELSAALEAREELEENMQAQCQKMDHMSRLSVLGQLSGTLAHELNQPLATIGNYARSLTRRMWTGNLSDEVVAQAAHEIAEQAERAAGILEGIRDFARKRPSRREDCDIRKLVDEIVTLFHGMLPHAPEIRIDDRLPDGRKNIHVDRLQVQQVLLNLLKNAYDAHCAIDRAGEPINIAMAPAEERTRITVRDHGMGLADADQSRLFEPFFTTKPDGMGLGLSICKNIVEAHGGQLVATQPDDGRGLCLSFTLPVTVAVLHDAN
jgi:two-component system sensor histidine kinase TtrS